MGFWRDSGWILLSTLLFLLSLLMLLLLWLRSYWRGRQTPGPRLDFNPYPHMDVPAPAHAAPEPSDPGPWPPERVQVSTGTGVSADTQRLPTVAAAVAGEPEPVGSGAEPPVEWPPVPSALPRPVGAEVGSAAPAADAAVPVEAEHAPQARSNS